MSHSPLSQIAIDRVPAISASARALWNALVDDGHVQGDVMQILDQYPEHDEKVVIMLTALCVGVMAYRDAVRRP